jgi:hypothetical protein
MRATYPAHPILIDLIIIITIIISVYLLCRFTYFSVFSGFELVMDNRY